MSAPQSPPSSKRDVVTGIARDATAGAVIVRGDGGTVYVAGLPAWPADALGRRVRAAGTIVTAARPTRARQDEHGNWNQGVAGDSAGETWLDAPEWSAEGPDAAPWTVTVADGSGSVTTFTQPIEGPAAWHYRPVTPAESSSGVYSGGAPASGTLTASQADALWEHARAAEGEPADKGRAKGTLLVEVESPAGRCAVVVSRADAVTLDGWLRALRGQ